MSGSPSFSPEPAHAGALLLFILHTDDQPHRTVLTAAAHSDDFDDLLALIPPDCAGWHILSAPIGQLVGGSDPDRDRDFDTILPPAASADDDARREPRPLDRFLGFKAGPDGFGAYSIVGTAATAEELLAAGAAEVFDWHTSTMHVAGVPAGVVPSFEQIEAFQDVLAEWQLEQEAMGKPASAELTAASVAQARMMQDAVLPDGWETLPTDMLRDVVRAAEEAIGKTPEELAAMSAEVRRNVGPMVVRAIDA